MDRAEILFEPKAYLHLSQSDLAILFECSEHHYDGTCRSFSRPAGCLWGARNSEGDWVFTSREVNNLLKILEEAALVYAPQESTERLKEAFRLSRALRSVFLAIAEKMPDLVTVELEA